MVSNIFSIPLTLSKRLTIVVIIVAIAVILSTILLFFSLNTQTNYGPGPIDLKVSPDKPLFTNGEEVSFTFAITNNQSWPVAQPNLLETNITKGNTVVEQKSERVNSSGKISTFPSNSVTELHWTWLESRNYNQTIRHEPGNYTLSVRLEGYGYSAVSDCTFEVR
jgi:hypothetical protein